MPRALRPEFKGDETKIFIITLNSSKYKQKLRTDIVENSCIPYLQ